MLGKFKKQSNETERRYMRIKRVIIGISLCAILIGAAGYCGWAIGYAGQEEVGVEAYWGGYSEGYDDGYTDGNGIGKSDGNN